MKEAIFIQGKAIGNFRIVCTVKNINKRVSKTTVNKVSNISIPKKKNPTQTNVNTYGGKAILSKF